MPQSKAEQAFESFALLTPRFILLPTPIAVSIPSYRALYANLHADPVFCEMGFGPHFLPRNWTDEEAREQMQLRDVGLCWEKRGLGDFAVGVRPSSLNGNFDARGKELAARVSDGKDLLVKGGEFESLCGADLQVLHSIEWVGYAGVRDATTTSLPAETRAEPSLPSWREMAEVRYGVAPRLWGAGVAREAFEAVMRWAVDEMGVVRFIAETERDNKRSARVLEKLGFSLSGTNYWKEPSEVEWELIA